MWRVSVHLVRLFVVWPSSGAELALTVPPPVITGKCAPLQQKQENCKEMPMFGELAEVRCHGTKGETSRRSACNARCSSHTLSLWCIYFA